jgi:hypothetical protein
MVNRDARVITALGMQFIIASGSFTNRYQERTSYCCYVCGCGYVNKLYRKCINMGSTGKQSNELS